MKTAVYMAVIDPNTELTDVYPPQRQSEIDRCSNEGVRLEKYTAWKLLEAAVRQSVGLPMETVAFSKNAYGKWRECVSCLWL